MKKQILPSLISLAGGAIALILRLLQNKTGFEPATGLPVAGNPYALFLPIFLVVIAVALAMAARPFRACQIPVFPQDFSAKNSSLLAIPVAGVLLTGISGMIPALANISPDAAVSAGSQASVSQLIFAATALIPALALLSAFSACKYQGARSSMRISQKFDAATLLLIPPVALVIRLVLVYRLCSIDPVLNRYYLQLLALIFMTLAYFFFAAFAVCSGKPFRFVLCACLAVMLSVAVLADCGEYPELLFYGGNAMILLGALLLLPCRSKSSDS